MKKIIRTESLTKQYRQGNLDVLALKNINISICSNEFVAIIGRSGSGKTTLLNLLTGLDSPSEGKVYINEIDITCMNENQLCIYRRKNIGFVFQFFNLIPELSCYENIILPAQLDNKGVDMNYINELVEILKLTDRLKHLPYQLSGGEQQRAALARSLANKPSILLCDEPTGNLDEATSSEVINMIINLKNILNQTIILVTHDKSIAMKADRIIRVKNGLSLMYNFLTAKE